MVISANSSVGHYENFPVASILIPHHLRVPIMALYRFARAADDLADEGDDSADIKIVHLQDFLQSFENNLQNKFGTNELYDNITAAMAKLCQNGLPAEYPRGLITAFTHDLKVTRYALFDDVFSYCKNSANPVGRSLLHFYNKVNDENLQMSDAICTALQLINFWQDVNIDWKKSRIYIPADYLAKHGFDSEGENSINLYANGEKISDNWRSLMADLVTHSRELMLCGAKLPDIIGGRCGFELRLMMIGGLTILRKIEKVEGDVFNHRPALAGLDWPKMLIQTICKVY